MLGCRIQDKRTINSRGARGVLLKEYLGSDRLGGAYALVGSVLGFALEVRRVRRFGRGGIIRGQKCRKRAAGSIRVHKYEPAMMCFGDPARDGQAQASSRRCGRCRFRGPQLMPILRARRVQAKKSLENFLLRFGRDARPAIVHGERIFATRALAGHVDLPALGRVLDGVVEQVHREPPH
jgi:hypothetical protein